MIRRPMVLLALLASGCTTLGGAVKGDFSCRAPKGGCAPTGMIDAAATAGVAEQTQSPVTAKPETGRFLPQRSGERVLTIIFPTRIDAAGVLHDEATAHLVVEAPRWSLVPDPTNRFSRSPAPSTLREAVAGASASATEGLDPLPDRAPPPAADPNANPPGADALRAARAGHRVARPSLVSPTPRGAPLQPDTDPFVRPTAPEESPR